MKTRYLIAIVTLVLLFVAFQLSLVLSELAKTSWLSSAISGTAVFVALIVSVIALHGADKKEPIIKATIEALLATTEPKEHRRDDIVDRVADSLRHKLDPFHSARVHFKLVNKSKRTLIRPTITFRLPLDRQHPHRNDRGIYELTFNSNLYNNQEQLRTLQYGDTALISNSNLPYWNHGDELVIWIRMALDAPNRDAFEIQVSVNAENAQGITTKLMLDPNILLKSTSRAPDVTQQAA